MLIQGMQDQQGYSKVNKASPKSVMWVQGQQGWSKVSQKLVCEDSKVNPRSERSKRSARSVHGQPNQQGQSKVSKVCPTTVQGQQWSAMVNNCQQKWARVTISTMYLDGQMDKDHLFKTMARTRSDLIRPDQVRQSHTRQGQTVSGQI